MSTPDDETLAPKILATLWSLVAISAVFISLKTFARVRRRVQLWWDDYVMLLSWVCLVLGSACLTYGTTRGLGRHVEFVASNDRSTVMFYGVISAVMYMAASVWSKVSFALFLLRISSSGCTEWVKRVVLGVILTLNVMLVIVAPMFFISCQPSEKIWSPETDGVCWDGRIKVFWASFVAAYSGVTDLVLAFLPWKIIWCLPFKKRDKIGLVAIMSLGIFAAVASFIKCAQIGILVSEDFTFEGWKLILWSVLEPTLTHVAASVPVVRPLLRDLIRSCSAARASNDPEDKRQQWCAFPGFARPQESALSKLPCHSNSRRDNFQSGSGVDKSREGGETKEQQSNRTSMVVVAP